MSLLEELIAAKNVVAATKEEVASYRNSPPGPAPQPEDFETSAEYFRAVQRHELEVTNHRGLMACTEAFLPAQEAKVKELEAQIAALRKTVDPKFVALDKAIRQALLAIENFNQALQRVDTAAIDLVQSGATKLHPRAGLNLVGVSWVDFKVPEITVNAEEFRIMLSTWQAPPSLPEVRPLPDGWEEKASAQLSFFSASKKRRVATSRNPSRRCFLPRNSSPKSKD